MINKLVLFIILLTLVTSSFAGVTGKIAGIVLDEKSGEPLPGVNLVLQGTLMGSATDVHGYYHILNVPPRVYTLQASYIGYNNVEVLNVEVSVDLTTNINIEMSETTLELMETITVVSDRPLIKKDEVAARHYVSSEEIEIQPVDSFEEIARNQAGVVGNHFRGGRTSEVLVMVDGIPVKDPAGTYSGNLGNFTSDVPEFGIQEMEVSLGGFTAEYGNVQSGILNLALNEGGQKYAGRFRFTSNNFGISSINHPTGRTSYQILGASDTLNWEKTNRLLQYIYEFNLSGPEPITTYLLPKLGVKVPGSVLLSLSSEISDRYQGNFINQESLDKTLQGKLTYRISPKHKITVGGIINDREWDQFYYAASKYGPSPDYPINELRLVSNDTLIHYHYVQNPSEYRSQQGSVSAESGSWRGDSYSAVKNYYMAGMQDYLWDYSNNSNTGYLIWTHTLSARSFYEVRLNNFYTNYHYATKDIDDRDGDGNTEEELVWDPTQPGPHPIYRERQDNYWWIRGDDPGYRDQKSWTRSIKADLVSQVTNNHLLKGGLELYWHRTKVENISWTLGYGIFRKDIWDEETFDFGAYIQDKLEFAGIIALVGLRFDAFNPNGSGPVYYPADYSYPYTGYDESGFPIINDPQKAEISYQFSPRVGISHPITANNILYFNYGHYFQRPDGYFLYRNHYLKDFTKVGNYVGNPGLLPEKTVSYELGVEHLFTSDLKVTVTGYYKDVNNLMNWQKYVGRSIQNIELNVYTNADYGNTKGLEITLNKRTSQFWGANINYTYSIAKGRSSSYSGGYGSFTDVRRMNILNYDQTHTVNANITLFTPEKFGPALGSFYPFADWTSNIQYSYGSGLPYSSFGSGLTNDKRMPSTTTTDLKLIRHIRLDYISFDLFLDIFNLFNNRNVLFIGDTQYYDSVDSPVRGDPAVIGRDGISGSYIRHPQAYSVERRFRFGVVVKF